MSRIGKNPVPVPSGVSIDIAGQTVTAKGKLGTLKLVDLPRVYNGLGISILSTPRGVMSDNEARAAKVGGEVLCRVF